MPVAHARAATIPEVEHHVVEAGDTTLHYVSAGTQGSPILLVHGFPESWWAFHKVIPLLAGRHRVFAVDLRGFGDSAVAGEDHTSAVAAEDLYRLIRHLGLGPVHLAGQDIASGTLYRLATAHPDVVASLTAVEMGLAGFGLAPDEVEALAEQALAVLAHPDLVPLFGPGSRAEQPLTGMVGDVVVTGVVDRMAVLPDEILVADFKTNRAPPADVADTPVRYLRQLAAYRAVLRGAEPRWVPAEAEEALLDLFLLEKAAYEIRYEAANRPSWIGIPLAGLHAIAERLPTARLLYWT